MHNLHPIPGLALTKINPWYSITKQNIDQSRNNPSFNKRGGRQGLGVNINKESFDDPW